ncbi:MAG: response regulator [Chloroflexi bacterium]|nr:response regulator [Chloroflexota bacterium]
MESASILVVDDEPGIALLCTRILKRAGYETQAETNPRAAIEHLGRNRFDLLLVDIRMPEVDGFDVISRAKRAQPDIAVLVMTGFGTVETAIRALRQGVDGLLLKPFERGEELISAVEQALTDNRRKRDSARAQALRPLFDATGKLFSETDSQKLNALIVDTICAHLQCTNAAFYRVAATGIELVAKRGSVPLVNTPGFATQLLRRVDADGNPIIVNATGPGEQDAQSLLADLKLGAAILIPITRADLRIILFAARDAGVAPFRGADLELFHILASQSLVALENARLYADLRAYVRKVEESQQALLRSEKMAAAGRLTASIAHEVNNPLQSVQNCLHIAGREDVPAEKRKEYFDLARAELERLMKTMQRMLDFYRPGSTRTEPVDVLELLKHVLSLTSQQMGQRHIEVKTQFPDSLPLIHAVNSQIQQIFFNLILNAFDVMPAGGTLWIRARGLDTGVEIQFEDSGPGIPEELRNNIFEPFFSTKDGGTGLGLTVSYNIVTAHGGTLDLVKGNGDGACFRLFLPMGAKQ